MEFSELLMDERFVAILVVLTLWSIPWKGVALWKAANRKEKKWFIALLIINTAAILEIFYLMYWVKNKESKDKIFSRV